MGTTWTPEQDKQLTALLAAQDDADRVDADRYRLLRNLRKGDWAQSIMRRGKHMDLAAFDAAVDAKGAEIRAIIDEARRES